MKTLKLENESLKLENKSLTLENESLTLENKSLTLENESLTLENESLKLKTKSPKDKKKALKHKAQVLMPFQASVRWNLPQYFRLMMSQFVFMHVERPLQSKGFVLEDAKDTTPVAAETHKKCSAPMAQKPVYMLSLDKMVEGISMEASVLGLCKGEDLVSSFANDVCKAFAVFDGHGGKFIASTMANGLDEIPSFCQYLCTNFLTFNKSISVEDYIKVLFLEYDILLKNHHSGGSTATVCLTFEENIYLAYVGDSAAMVINDGHLVYQTLNHSSADDPEEQKRMEKAKVYMSSTTDFVVKSDDVIQVISDSKYHHFTHGYLTEKLAMTRAFGHYNIKAYKKIEGEDTFSSQSALTAEPTIFTVPIEKGLEIVIGSDGLWDVVKADSPFEEITSVLELAKGRGESVSQALAKFAETRWKKEWTILQGERSFKMTMTHSVQWDDISCMYLRF